MNKAASLHTAGTSRADRRDVPIPASVSYAGQDLQATPDEKWEKAGIGNAFIFANVMRNNPDLLLELLQYTFPEMGIEDFETAPDEEVSIRTSHDAHGIRLDIRVRDVDGHVFDIEMQVNDEKNIPRRIRYYSSTLDQTCLRSGEDYNSLRDSIVLFITAFDPFGLGLYRYTFRNICVEKKDFELGDGATKTVLNACASIGEIPPALKGFLDLVKGIEPVPDAAFANRVQEKVRTAKLSSELRRQFMNWEMTLLVERNKGRGEGTSLALIKQVQKKVRKDKPLSCIIDELESDEATIHPIYEAVVKAPPSSTPEQILAALPKKYEYLR